MRAMGNGPYVMHFEVTLDFGQNVMNVNSPVWYFAEDNYKQTSR